jgi:hypothetical protein
MRNRRRSLVAALVATAALSVGLAVPASGQPEQNGLVNVTIVDTAVQIPVAVAANICDVNVNVLAEQIRPDGADCTADAESDAVFDPGTETGGPAEQNGLVNVFIDDLFIQVPVSVALNLCDVNANVLAQQLRGGGATCDAVADSSAG